ncbi:DoxX family protein [Pontibacter sp. E15-1]|uniref:DoxX family protein n=1 Tax=Pontibacter sp. E15-1 TaxID=2919918 RepID=UPI001F4FE9AD|nr:DoxX family protein [Pontibacter sp. E15-1]MCJ8165995.1 DoxX family protein [Pontibacter sp. E15-1]
MKIVRIITIIISVLAVAMVAFSGIMKLAGGAEGAKALEAVGVGQYRIMLGIAEIVFAALFAFPKTMRLGFILLASYFAGALATELSHAAPLNALIPLVLIWVSAFLRDKALFLPGKKELVLTPQSN